MDIEKEFTRRLHPLVKSVARNVIYLSFHKYSQRSYMGRCSLPISLRRPFVPLRPCASNKHSNQENRLSLARDGCVKRLAIANMHRMHRMYEFRRACLMRFISRSLLSMQRIPQMRQTARNGSRQGPAIKSPTNDKQIPHSGSPIYRCRNILPHSSYAPRDILAVAEIIIEEYTGDE